MALVLALLGALAIMRGRSALAVLAVVRRAVRRAAVRRRPPRRNGTFAPREFPGAARGSAQGLITAASLGVVSVVLLTSAAVLWAVMGSGSRRQP